jgi:hypothetical protein
MPTFGVPSRVSSRVIATTGIVLALNSTAALAQESLLPSASWGLMPTVAAWHFSTPFAQSSGGVSDVLQVAIPFRAKLRLGDNWNADVSGAATNSRMQVASLTSSSAGSRTLSLQGTTDVKLRLTGRLWSDHLLLTLGGNLPTGTTGLDADGTAVLQTVGAPALQMPVGALGLGPGGTVGLVTAVEAGGWALAIGGSVEKRSEYTPIELALTGGTSKTAITPGSAMHLTVGADHQLGSNRISLLVVADAYSKDLVATSTPVGAGPNSSYTLGPQVSAVMQLDLAGPSWREAAFNVAYRRRSEFKDASGANVAGSSGSYLEASLGGIKGGPTGSGFIFSIDARQHSGLKFTDALVGAQASVAGMTIGAEYPLGSTALRIALHGQYGVFDTGTTKSNGLGGQLVFVFGARREAQ